MFCGRVDYTCSVAGLYWRVQVMDPLTYGIFFFAFTLITTWVVAFAYRAIKLSLKHK